MVTHTLTCLDCGQVNRVPAERLDSGPKCGTCGTPLLAHKPAEVDLATLRKAAARDSLPLVVDFWAPWCGPCRQMAPEFAKAAQALKGKARLVKLNTQDHDAAGAAYRIRGIPTMIRFEKGKETARQSGAMPAAQILRWAEQG